ncbi:hypothetical protein PYCC9005_003502 [Savitreella phatthalungensis]
MNQDDFRRLLAEKPKRTEPEDSSSVLGKRTTRDDDRESPAYSGRRYDGKRSSASRVPIASLLPRGFSKHSAQTEPSVTAEQIRRRRNAEDDKPAVGLDFELLRKTRAQQAQSGTAIVASAHTKDSATSTDQDTPETATEDDLEAAFTAGAAAKQKQGTDQTARLNRAAVLAQFRSSRMDAVPEQEAAARSTAAEQQKVPDTGDIFSEAGSDYDPFDEVEHEAVDAETRAAKLSYFDEAHETQTIEAPRTEADFFATHGKDIEQAAQSILEATAALPREKEVPQPVPAEESSTLERETFDGVEDEYDSE